MAAITAQPAFAAPASVPTVSVAYGDLKLTSPADAAVMLQRVRRAGAAACQKGRFMVGSDIATIERFEACRHAAVSKAVTDLNAPLVTATFNKQPGGVRARSSDAAWPLRSEHQR
jgi:UrcA family protein